MRISQTLTKQPTQTALRTDHRMMSFREANETAIRQKAQIGVVVSQTRKGVESDAVQRYKVGAENKDCLKKETQWMRW
jgi:hypothetical protein